MQKTFLAVLVLASSILLLACQKPSPPVTPQIPTTPSSEETSQIPTEEPTEESNLLETDTFKITVTPELTVEKIGNYSRIQNYTPDRDLYTLKDGEYYIEFISLTDETYNEESFRDSYKNIEETELNGKKALYGTDRNVAGDGNNGIGYFIENNIVINISTESENGLKAAQDLLKALTFK